MSIKKAVVLILFLFSPFISQANEHKKIRDVIFNSEFTRTYLHEDVKLLYEFVKVNKLDLDSVKILVNALNKYALSGYKDSLEQVKKKYRFPEDLPFYIVGKRWNSADSELVKNNIIEGGVIFSRWVSADSAMVPKVRWEVGDSAILFPSEFSMIGTSVLLRDSIRNLPSEAVNTGIRKSWKHTYNGTYTTEYQLPAIIYEQEGGSWESVGDVSTPQYPNVSIPIKTYRSGTSHPKSVGYRWIEIDLPRYYFTRPFYVLPSNSQDYLVSLIAKYLPPAYFDHGPRDYSIPYAHLGFGYGISRFATEELVSKYEGKIFSLYWGRPQYSSWNETGHMGLNLEPTLSVSQREYTRIESFPFVLVGMDLLGGQISYIDWKSKNGFKDIHDFSLNVLLMGGALRIWRLLDLEGFLGINPHLWNWDFKRLCFTFSPRVNMSIGKLPAPLESSKKLSFSLFAEYNQTFFGFGRYTPRKFLTLGLGINITGKE